MLFLKTPKMWIFVKCGALLNNFFFFLPYPIKLFQLEPIQMLLISNVMLSCDMPMNSALVSSYILRDYTHSTQFVKSTMNVRESAGFLEIIFHVNGIVIRI